MESFLYWLNQSVYWLFSMLPVLASIYVYKKTHNSFLPFFIFLWLAAFNEFVSILTIYFFRNNAINNNFYVLFEGLLLLWIFHSWGRLKGRFINFPVLASLFVITWVADNLIFNKITTFNSFYRAGYAITVVFLSLNHINRLLLEERKSLLKNAAFLICMSFVIFYSYKSMVEVFYMYREGVSKTFLINLFQIVVVLNPLCNIIFTIAVLWIPKRQKFTLPY